MKFIIAMATLKPIANGRFRHITISISRVSSSMLTRDKKTTFQKAAS